MAIHKDSQTLSSTENTPKAVSLEALTEGIKDGIAACERIAQRETTMKGRDYWNARADGHRYVLTYILKAVVEMDKFDAAQSRRIPVGKE